MLFNFLKNKQKKEEDKIEDDICASITYYIKRGQKGAVLDVELLDYDTESTKALCLLLDTIGSDRCYLETINMIKQYLVENKHENVLNSILMHIASTSQTKLLNIYKEKIKEEPCIKPSEVIR
jgi:hypothetical protein